MNKTKLALLSAISLAIVSLFSCSSDDSSNSVSVDKYEYCVFADDKLCLAGPFSSCESGGHLSNSCPYGDGSVVSGLSSSSGGNLSLSSSSINVSSSSSYPVVSSSSSALCTPSGNNDTHYCSNGVPKEYGFVTYEEQTYKTVKIGTQVWMAENLNYNVKNSKCYYEYVEYYYDDESNKIEVTEDMVQDFCNKYGRLYDWATAMGISSTYNKTNYSASSNYQGICPNGWHLPSMNEFDVLRNYIEGDKNCTSCSGKYLKTISGWYKNNNGTDDYGFAALPSGYISPNYNPTILAPNLFFSSQIKSTGFWWSTENPFGTSGDGAQGIQVSHYEDDGFVMVYDKEWYVSVRCVKD